MMGCRHKKARAVEPKELWTGALVSQGKKAGIGLPSLPADKPRIEPALPPMPEARLSCRQMGCFRGRKIFETNLSISYLN
jgi:hypothetical protein